MNFSMDIVDVLSKIQAYVQHLEKTNSTLQNERDTYKKEMDRLLENERDMFKVSSIISTANENTKLKQYISIQPKDNSKNIPWKPRWL